MSSSKRPSAISTILPQLANYDLSPDATVGEQYEAEIACSDAEKEEVYRLAYQVYLAKGFVSANDKKMLQYQYDTNAETVVLMIRNHSGQLVASATLVYKNKHEKLPCEKLFSDEIETLMYGRKNYAEICRLVVDDSYRHQKKILVALFDAIRYYVCNINEPSHLMIRVNPRHQIYYQKMFYFEAFEEVKTCPLVNAPAILMYLNICNYKNLKHEKHLATLAI